MANSLRTNLGNVAVQFLHALKVKVTATTVEERLQSHADYPSLFSLSDVLEKLHIENAAYEIEEQDKFGELEPPFVAYLNQLAHGSDFVLVTGKSAAGVSYIGDSKKVTTIPETEFLQKWNKVVLLAEPNEKSGEEDYAKSLAAEQKLANKNTLLKIAAVGIVALLAAGVFAGLSDGESWLGTGAVLLTKLFGVCCAGLLLVLEVDSSNTFVKNICSAGKQTNCDAVINSKAGKFLGMSWSEAGFFYFVATLLFLLLPGIPMLAKAPWLGVAATVVSPYIVFSIYYQYKVVKQWCPLCLAVQAVLALELVWAVTQFWLADIKLWDAFTEPVMLAAVAACILIPMTLWYFVKPFITRAKSEPQYRYSYKRLLYNPDYFNHLLQQQPAAPDGWQNLGITIGNPQASNTIIKVCNPYCGPCASAHPVLEDIVRHNNDINVKVIFTATNQEGDIKAPPVRHLLAIAAKGERGLAEKALDDWYLAEKKDYNTFAAKYPMNGELAEQNPKLDAMEKWCNDAQIAFTPTIFVNGKKIPENYNVQELKHIL